MFLPISNEALDAQTGTSTSTTTTTDEEKKKKREKQAQALLSMSKQALSNLGSGEPAPARMIDPTPQNFDVAGSYKFSRFMSPFRRRDESV